TRFGPEFVDSAAVALERELLRHRQAGRPRTDDGHVPAGRFGRISRQRVTAGLLALGVGAKRRELADGDGRLGVLVRADGKAHHARTFTQALLRTEAAAHLRQVARFSEDVRRAEDVADFEQRERTRDVVVDRARLLAGRRRALDAARGLDLRRVEV